MSFIEQLKYRNELLFYFGLANLMAAIVFLVLAYTTNTMLNGVNAWFKPFKFAASTVLYCWAVLWYCYYLKDFNIALFSWTIVLTLGFEVAYIAFRAGRAELSHFNTSTPLAGALFALMGIAATVVTFYTGYVCVLFFTNKFPQLPAYYVWAIRLGLLLFIVFALEGFVMGAAGSHTIGGSDDSHGIPVLNWSKKFGDLRIAHFIGMHALQVLPLASYYLLKNTKAVFLTATLYGLLAVFTYVQASKGISLFKQQANKAAL